MKQTSFSDLTYEHKKKTTLKERFLAEMDAILPWDKLLKPILRKNPKPGQARHPIPADEPPRVVQDEPSQSRQPDPAHTGADKPGGRPETTLNDLLYLSMSRLKSNRIALTENNSHAVYYCR